MKRGVIGSYLSGITDLAHGESYSKILKYFFPEYITALLLYSALHLIDAYFVGNLKSTSTYATIGVTNTLLHFIIKIAEGFSVGSIVLTGQYNGAKDYKSVGHTFANTFWVTCMLGTTIALTLYFGAYWIYYLYGVSDKMINIGIPFLRLRALGVFFTFIYFGFIAFLRGIKNTKIPMYTSVVGAIVFLFFDYVLIFGKFGFPKLNLQGSALATIIQYMIMLLLAAYTVLFNSDYKKYSINLFATVSTWSSIKRLFSISWPVIMDKSIMAIAYIWMGAMIATMGTHVIACFTVIKDLERIAFLPAIAFAQVITLLVSNDFGALNFEGIKTNIKKVVFLASIFVFMTLFILLLSPKYFISFFDHKNSFTDIAARVFPIISPLVFLDIVQLILSGAMRAIGDVKVVMWTRFVVIFGLFFPISYYISTLSINDHGMKFTLIYGIFYICSIFMNFVYINKLRSDNWKTPGFKGLYGKNNS